MDGVTSFMSDYELVAEAWGEALGAMQRKPILWCENCTKSKEEIEGDVKFMQCSVCKSRLDFAVH